jgi:fluoride exporter
MPRERWASDGWALELEAPPLEDAPLEDAAPQRPTHQPLPTDPDVDLHIAGQRAELSQSHGAVLAAIAIGGALGSLARYGVGLAFPAAPAGFPWGTFAVNVIGSLLIGILMVVVTDVWSAHPLVRPFAGVGILGGFTTFSTYVVDIQRMVGHDAGGTALAYLFATLAGAVGAVWVGMTATRSLIDRFQPAAS